MENNLSIKKIVFAILLIFSNALISADYTKVDDANGYCMTADIYVKSVLCLEEDEDIKYPIFIHIKLEDHNNKTLFESDKIQIGKGTHGTAKIYSLNYQNNQIWVAVMFNEKKIMVFRLNHEKDKKTLTLDKKFGFKYIPV